jgi:uncharacterized Tic20 family protein
MEERKIWGMDHKTLLMLGWLAQIFTNVAGLVVAIILTYYFREQDKKEPWLSEGFRQMANFSLAVYILMSAMFVSFTILVIIPGIGFIVSPVLFVGIAIVAIYSLYVYIKGTIEAGNGNIYLPKYTFEFFK